MAASRLRSSVPRSDESDSARKPLGDALEILTTSLENCSIGLAFYDQRFRCQAINAASAATGTFPAHEMLGQAIYHSFANQAKELKELFRQVFKEGLIVSNFELRPTEPAAVNGAARWLLNLFPIKDARRVCLVAAAFCRKRAEDGLETRLSQFVCKFQEAAAPIAERALTSFPEMLADSLQAASRSVRLLRDSLPARSALSGMRLEADLLPLALFLDLSNSSAAQHPLETGRMEPDPATEPSSVPPLAPAPPDVPSPRELQVLRHLATGQSNKEIGIALGISTRTVETYRARIIRKLSLHSTAELVRYAIRHKIVDL